MKQTEHLLEVRVQTPNYREKAYWKDQLAQEGSLRSLERKGDLTVVLKGNTWDDYAQSPRIYAP